MNPRRQRRRGVEEHAHPPVTLAPGESVCIGDVELTVASIGDEVDDDTVTVELRPSRDGVVISEGDDGVVLTQDDGGA